MNIADFLEFTLNLLVKSCHDALVDDSVPGLSKSKPPYFFYQPQDKLMYLVVPVECGSNSCQIRVNRAVYRFISGFPCFKINEDDYLIRYLGPDNALVYSPPIQTDSNKFPKWTASGEAIKIPQEYPTDYRFNELQSVIVTSNLPIRQETLPQTTQQNVFSPSNPLSYISTLPVLTDFRPDVDQFGLQNSSLIFFRPENFAGLTCSRMGH
jgi:hypothetical protein